MEPKFKSVKLSC